MRTMRKMRDLCIIYLIRRHKMIVNFEDFGKILKLCDCGAYICSSGRKLQFS